MRFSISYSISIVCQIVFGVTIENLQDISVKSLVKEYQLAIKHVRISKELEAIEHYHEGAKFNIYN